MRERSDPEHIINRKNKLGYNALYLASKYGNLEVVKFLAQQQAIYNHPMQVV